MLFHDHVCTVPEKGGNPFALETYPHDGGTFDSTKTVPFVHQSLSAGCTKNAFCGVIIEDIVKDSLHDGLQRCLHDDAETPGHIISSPGNHLTI
jgi:hypothetical protein